VEGAGEAQETRSSKPFQGHASHQKTATLVGCVPIQCSPLPEPPGGDPSHDQIIQERDQITLSNGCSPWPFSRSSAIS
jgi:hypothetical protein